MSEPLPQNIQKLRKAFPVIALVLPVAAFTLLVTIYALGIHEELGTPLWMAVIAMEVIATGVVLMILYKKAWPNGPERKSDSGNPFRQ